MSEQNLGHGLTIPSNLWGEEVAKILTPNVVELLSQLHQKFEADRKQLLKSRNERQKSYDSGSLPEYLDRNSQAASTEWKVGEIPKDYLKRRVEITGPVGDTKMVINMLARNPQGDRADTAMLDFEDSMKPSFQNVLNGYFNVIGAAEGSLEFAQPEKTDKVYRLNPDDMAGLMVRVRGLHLDESNIRMDGENISAGLLDLAICFIHTAKTLIKQNKTPKFYIPKCEHYLEARWWNQLFNHLEVNQDLPQGTLKCTFLIETLPAAFQIEEILFEIKEHAIGLNVGRWDKIFSDIKVLRNHSDRISPDRAQINMSKFWMDNYAKRLVKICHQRGAMAIGGMSAFTPGKESNVREKQLAKVKADKENEFNIGHDGCWVSHPFFIGMALAAFPKENQLDVLLEKFDKYPDLLMKGSNEQSLDGLRTNIRVGIAYQRGWDLDIGCVAWDNLMEDLATLEISRAQTWQWLKHGITLKSGEKITEELILKIFDEELKKILLEVDSQMKGIDPKKIEKTKQEFTIASKKVSKLFLKKDLDNFFQTESERKE